MSKKIDANLIVAIGVLIASFGALFVYMRQASIMTEQTKILLGDTWTVKKTGFQTGLESTKREKVSECDHKGEKTFRQ